MAQSIQHDQATLILELSAASTPNIHSPITSPGSQLRDAIVSIPLVQNIRQVTIDWGIAMPAVKTVAIIAALLIGLLLSVPHAALAQEPDEAATLTQQIIQLYKQGRYSEAIPFAQRLLTISEPLGPDHPDVANSLNILGFLYRFQGRYAEAEPLFKRALAIREKALGPDHPDVAHIAEQSG